MQQARAGAPAFDPAAQRASEAALNESLLKKLDILHRRKIAQGWTETPAGDLIPPGWVYAGDGGAAGAAIAPDGDE